MIQETLQFEDTAVRPSHLPPLARPGIRTSMSRLPQTRRDANTNIGISPRNVSPVLSHRTAQSPVESVTARLIHIESSLHRVRDEMEEKDQAIKALKARLTGFASLQVRAQREMSELGCPTDGNDSDHT